MLLLLTVEIIRYVSDICKIDSEIKVLIVNVIRCKSYLRVTSRKQVFERLLRLSVEIH